jgi:5'-deoxynucleotidase YfbR-like HD superfamily hydrolase
MMTNDTKLLADALVDLGRLAMQFSRIDRTACYHPGGERKETDADHTVMLGWLAPALAARCFADLDVGLVAQYALVHDAVEAYAGDTQTLQIDADGRAAKKAREAAAHARIHAEFSESLPWFPDMIERYETQFEPEARYVRGLDKCLPKIVHLLDGCAGLHEFGIARGELAATLAEQDTDMRRYVGEFTALLDVRAELVARVLAHPSWDEQAATFYACPNPFCDNNTPSDHDGDCGDCHTRLLHIGADGHEVTT